MDVLKEVPRLPNPHPPPAVRVLPAASGGTLIPKVDDLGVELEVELVIGNGRTEAGTEARIGESVALSVSNLVARLKSCTQVYTAY